MKEIVGSILSFFVVISIICMMYFIFLMVDEKVIEIKQNQIKFHEPTEKELKIAHKYHGINYAEQNEIDGEWYFKRDGKVCKLF
jgi:uncharacterized metal-binding protein